MCVFCFFLNATFGKKTNPAFIPFRVWSIQQRAHKNLPTGSYLDRLVGVRREGRLMVLSVHREGIRQVFILQLLPLMRHRLVLFLRQCDVLMAVGMGKRLRIIRQKCFLKFFPFPTLKVGGMGEGAHGTVMLMVYLRLEGTDYNCLHFRGR